MSFFQEANDDAYSIAPEAAATGPRVGFLDAFETSYQQQVRGSAMYGIEKAFHEMEAAQVEALRKAGVEDIPHIADGAFGFFGSGAFSGDYMDAARFYQEGGDPEIAKRFDAYDKKIEDFGAKFPELNLRTSRDMWNEIRTTAQQYERKAQNDRNTLGGAVGSLMGGMAGSLNVESDPWNFATIPLGAFGNTVVGRIGGQGAAQGFIEGINQVTGVQEQRRLLGLDSGFADGLMRVGGAVIGGAALQGLGEGVTAGARRFFRSTPLDPAPAYTPPAVVREAPPVEPIREGVVPAEPEAAAAKLVQSPRSYAEYLQEVSPFSISRAGKARTVLDMDYMKARLDDWSGELPFNIGPKTDTLPTIPRSDYAAPAPTIFDRVADASQVDDLARKVDPDTFRKYDKLADENETYRRWLKELDGPRKENTDSALMEINNKIDEIKEKISRSGAMKSKKLGKHLEALVAERDDTKVRLLSAETPDMAKVRAAIMANDEKMRDMAPVVSRAYARARNKWDNTQADRDAIKAMLREGRKTVGVLPEARIVEGLPKSLYDKAPILQQAARVEAAMPAGSDGADIASKVLAEKAKAADETLETYRAAVQKIVKDAEALTGKPEVKPGEPSPAEITVPGFKEPLHLDRDKVTIPNEDGNGTREVTLRQLFDEQNEVEADLKAVQSCSIK